MNKIYHANTNHWKAGAAIITSDKVNFRAKDIYSLGLKKSHNLMIKGQIDQENITVINIYDLKREFKTLNKNSKEKQTNSQL